jgi:hypothetical protein
VRRRLLSESELRMAARMAPAPVPAAMPVTVPVSVAPVPPVATPPDPDAEFLAAVPAIRRPAAEHCIAQARAGDPPGSLATAFGHRQRLAYAAVLTLVEQARNLPPEQATARLAEADRKRSEAESYAQAWRRWMAGRG